MPPYCSYDSRQKAALGNLAIFAGQGIGYRQELVTLKPFVDNHIRLW